MSSDEGQAASDPALEKTVSADEAGVTPGVDGGRLAAGTKLGRYEIVEFIGGGGMGWVYRAKDTELEREVAIKVVQPTVAGPKGRDRLLAEARAMAKLRHRAVVPVHDVGEYAGGVYVAMALVTGGTLHDWMHAEARPWRQVVARFLEAGRGLVAAHAAGIVHRDFKPRNVLLGEGGEVMVADFGIASASVAAGEGEGLAGGAREATSIVGTPAYMAPEQAAGQAVDARADQYSFCVSLWEGLHGQRPQEAETRTQGALLERSSAAPKSRRRVPGWLTDAVARGFAPAPEKRWPTLAALLERLERGLGRRRRVAVGVTFAMVLAAVVAAVTVARHAEEACPDPQPRIARAWGVRVRSEVIAAFAGTQVPFARDTLERILPVLDDYAAGLRARQRDYCRAARVERRESMQLMDQRMTCLERRLAALQGRADAFRADPHAALPEAVAATSSLPALSDCDDREAMLAYPLPGDPAHRRRIAEVEQALDGLELEAATGRDPQGRAARVQVVVERARLLVYPPTLARALELWARALNAAAAPADAAARELIETASVARDDVRVFGGWVALLEDLVQRQGKFAEAQALELSAASALARTGGRADLAGQLRRIKMGRAQRGDDFELAIALGREGVAAAAPGERSAALAALAVVLSVAGRPAEAIPLVEEAIGLAEASLGASHPVVGDLHRSLGVQFMFAGRFDEAEREVRRAVAILEAGLGARHPKLAMALSSLGNIARVRGDLEGSVASLQRAQAILEEAGDDVALVDTLASLASSAKLMSGPTVASPIYERALAVAERIFGRDHSKYITVEAGYAVMLIEGGDCGRGRALFTHVVGVAEALAQPAPRAVALLMLARCDANERKDAEAMAKLTEVVAICSKVTCPPPGLSMAQFALGALYYQSRRDVARGLRMVRDARRDFEKAGMPASVKMADDWLSANGR